MIELTDSLVPLDAVLLLLIFVWSMTVSILSAILSSHIGSLHSIVEDLRHFSSLAISHSPEHSTLQLLVSELSSLISPQLWHQTPLLSPTRRRRPRKRRPATSGSSSASPTPSLLFVPEVVEENPSSHPVFNEASLSKSPSPSSVVEERRLGLPPPLTNSNSASNSEHGTTAYVGNLSPEAHAIVEGVRLGHQPLFDAVTHTLKTFTKNLITQQNFVESLEKCLDQQALQLAHHEKIIHQLSFRLDNRLETG